MITNMMDNVIKSTEQYFQLTQCDEKFMKLRLLLDFRERLSETNVIK